MDTEKSKNAGEPLIWESPWVGAFGEKKIRWALRKTAWRFLKNLKIEPHMIQLCYCNTHPKNQNHDLIEGSALPYPLQHYSLKPKHGNKLSVHQQMHG